MASDIYQFDGTLLTTIQNYTIDSTSSTLILLGDGVKSYGETILQDIVWTTENFANTTSPGLPLQGQCWYDTSTNCLKVFNNGNWNAANGAIVTDLQPLNGFNPGAYWYDILNQQLNVWNGTNWDLVGPMGSGINTDPIENDNIPDNSKIDAISITDVIGASHQAFRITVGGTVVAIVSKDQTYVPTPPIGGFATINPGINVSTILVPNVPDPTIFRSTQDNLPITNNFFDLGSSTARFGYSFANNGYFNKVLIDTANNTANFNQGGTNFLTGTVSFGNTTTFGSTGSYPSAVILPGINLSNPELGAIEFDGQFLYATIPVAGVLTRLPFATGTITPAGSWGAVFTGTATDILSTINPTPPTTIPTNALMFGIIPATNISTTLTMTVIGGQKVNVLLSDGQTPPPAGSIIGGHVVLFKWNGTTWLAIADLTATSSIGQSLPFMPLSGGTMTGPLVFPSDPSTALQASPKQYMDEAVTAVNYLIANLTNAINGISTSNLLPLAGGTMTGFPVLPGNPTSASQAATKQYVDTAAASINTTSLVPLSGGTLTGVLTLAADPSSANQASTKQYVDNTIAAAAGNPAPTSLLAMQTFTASGTYTPTTNATIVFVTVCNSAGLVVFGRTPATSTSVTIGSTTSFGSISTSTADGTVTTVGKNISGFCTVIEFA